MRTWLVAMVSAGALASAGAALAQVENYSYMSPPPAQAQNPGPNYTLGQFSDGKIATPYERKLAFLKSRMQFLKARDGGQLSAEHAALIQRELEALNTQADRRRN